MKLFEKSQINLSRRIVVIALLTCIGIVLQIVEGMFDIFLVPGGKIGLANISALICLFILDGKSSVLVAFLRSFLGCLLYGGVPAMPYSMGGAILSAVAMWGLKAAFYPKLSQIGISMLGAFVHNAMQIIVAVIIFKSVKLFSYLPVLVLIGTIGGIVTGVGAKIFCKKIGIDKNEKNNTGFTVSKTV